MAVVTRYGSSAKDPTSTTQDKIPGEINGGKQRALKGTVELANGDSAGSKVSLGKIPSSARVSLESKMLFDAIAGNTSVKVGTVADDDCLTTAQNVSAGGSFNLANSVDIANLDKPFWKLQAGVTVDPGGDIEVWATLGNALTAGGTFSWNVPYSTV